MNVYRADLHIHTVLSPCGDLEMSPRAIVDHAHRCGLNLIAITDHNTTLHGPITRKLAAPFGITVLFGAEVTSREEAHCLCIFESEEQRVGFQRFIDKHLPRIPNDPAKFGYQVQVDENDLIVYQEERLLISALGVGVNLIAEETHRLGGLFIPAHVDRPRYSLTSQLGFIPPDLAFDAIEIFRTTNEADFMAKHKYLPKVTCIKNSDAHFTNQLGSIYNEFTMESPTLSEISKAFKGVDGRIVRS